MTQPPSRQRTPAGQQPDEQDKRQERDWEWRRRIRSNPHSHRVYRTVVGILGTVVMVAGLVMVPFPGPGWPVAVFHPEK